MKVKIIFAESSYDDEIISWGSVYDSITDWEEISDEDFEILRYNLFRVIPEKFKRAGFIPKILVKEDQVSIQDKIASIKEMLAEQKKKEEKEAQRREEAKLKRQLSKTAKKELTEKEIFEMLKAKFEKGE